MSEHKEEEAFETFVDIIAKLRGENGCPWDKEQTFESLKPCMVNEMTEALAGIDLYTQTGNAENLCEELGRCADAGRAALTDCQGKRSV